MQLAREVFNGGKNARRGAIDRLADDREAAVAHGIEELPAGEQRERVEIARGGFGMGCREDQIVGLQADDFFEVHLRPVLRGVHDAYGVGSAKGVGDESVFPDRDERVRPDDEKDTARRKRFEPGVQGGEASLKVGCERLAGFRRANNISQFLGGGDNFIDVASVGGIGGNAERFESAERVEAIDFFGDKNEVRMERCNFFEIRIDDAADLPFLLRVGRIVAIIRVADEVILHTEGVKRFG